MKSSSIGEFFCFQSFKKTDSPLVDFSYRTGYWLGDLTAKFQDGTVIKKTAEKFLDYQNLYFFCEEKCHSCHDHFGYQSDISAGDIWNYNRFKKSPQSTALICRTEIGELLVNNTFKAGKIHLETESAKEILDGQSRTLPFHYNTSARSVVGRLFGFRVKDTVNQKIYWNMYIVTFMALFNDYCSRTRLGRSIIFLIPNKIIKLYLYAFKLLEVLKK